MCDEAAAKRKQDDAEGGRGRRRTKTEGAQDARLRDTCETTRNATTQNPKRKTQEGCGARHLAHVVHYGQKGRINATARKARRTATRRRTREGELPRGSPPRSLRFGSREHSPELRADHGLHDRVAFARGRPKPRVRTENLLASTLGVPVAILGRQRLQGVFDLAGRLQPPRKRTANRLRGALLGLREGISPRDGLSRFQGLYGAVSLAYDGRPFAPANLIGLGAGHDAPTGGIVPDKREQVTGRIVLLAVQAQGDITLDLLAIEHLCEALGPHGSDPLGDKQGCGLGARLM